MSILYILTYKVVFPKKKKKIKHAILGSMVLFYFMSVKDFYAWGSSYI